MDILDIILAKSLTPQGKTDAYVAKANKAAAKAAKAEEDASAAIALVNEAAEDIEEKVSAAETLLETAQNAMETLQAEQLDIEDVDAEIKKHTLTRQQVSNDTAVWVNIQQAYPDGSHSVIDVVSNMYKSTGNLEDGSMTQKAITDALNLKADAATTASKQYVDNAIQNLDIPHGSGDTYLGIENAGRIAVVGEDGNVASGTVTEESLIDALIMTGGYVARDAVGLEVDYENKTFARTQQAVGKTMGSDFNQFPMYGGRKRCIVMNSGSIIRFEGESGYDDLLQSLENNEGAVMVYQPKFYYQRVPLNTIGGRVGKIVNRDSIMISATPQNGFKVHPLFVDANGEELDYVLLGAFEGNLYAPTDSPENVFGDITGYMLSSGASIGPITGAKGLTLEKAEILATHRGTGWHAMTMQAESANQMLELVEFGSLNGQAILGKGISDMAGSGTKNVPALSGATLSLGSASGAAASTQYIGTDSEPFTETTAGKVSISYRGLENPWGNTWTMLNGIIINGNGTTYGGVPYICKNFNYNYVTLSNNYESAGFSLPNNNGWISALGYGNKKYDWLLMPAAADDSANSVYPIGDNGWFDSNLTGNRMVVHGGSWSFGESNGPFYYGCDKPLDSSLYQSYGTRLIFIPTKNNIYNANIAKWQQLMNIGG